MERLGHSLGPVLLLVLMAGVVAAVFGRLAVGVVAGPSAAWPPRGCVGAPVDRLSPAAVTGQAHLCPSDVGTAAMLDLEHLEPMARYTAWVAYFEQPGLCSMASLLYQVRNFHQPCTLADLDGPDPRGAVQAIGETVAGAYGAAHLDLPLNNAATWQRGSQVWLLVGRPTPASTLTTSVATGHASRSPDQVDSKLFEARAIFELL